MNPRVTAHLAASFLLTLFGAPALAESTSVSGKVVDSETNFGLRKAYVRLFGSAGTYTAVSDDSGKFSFEKVEPGAYGLEAERQGYINGSYEESDTGSVQIRVDGEQPVKGIDIRLTRQAVISGRVFDEDGDLWVHADVTLFRSEWTAGRQTLREFMQNEVNDLAEFRIGQIPPGKYYLSARPDFDWDKMHQPSGKDAPPRQRTWYPNSLDVAQASPIIIGAGGQVSNVEIRIRRGSSHRVRGTLIGLADMPSDKPLGPFARGIMARPLSEAAGEGKNGEIRPNGTFEIEGLPPGNYEIRVSQGYPTVVLGKTQVRIDSRDIDDLRIQLTPPAPVKGRILLAEEESSVKMEDLIVQLPGSLVAAHVKADGTFEFPPIGADEYDVFVQPPGQGLYIKQIRYGDAVSSNGTISSSASGGELLLTLSTRAARVVGRIKGAAEHPQVVLISSAGRLSSIGKMRVASFDQTRQFLFQDLPPGTYKLYAFDGAPGGAWADPDFMKEVGSSAVDVELSEGDVKSIDIPVFPKAELARIVKKLGME